jgi:RNA polymerase sigma factor (sigma-70 family)
MPPPAEGLASRLFLGPALRTQPDLRLVTLVREGYEAAFEEIVRRYGRPLGRYAASIVGGRSEDVIQDAFSKALLALRRDDAEIELRPWLFRIVRNTALNDLRDSPPSPEVLAEALTGGGNPAEELERREELADLMRRLQALPEAQRAAIVMRELEGLSHEEIAAALGLTGGGARQAIYRARQALRDGLGMLIPLPLVQSMLAAASTPGVAETAAGAVGVGGAAGAGVGAGIALKATAATVLVAGAVGAGVALKPNTRDGDAEAASIHAARAPASEDASGALTGTSDDVGDEVSDGGERGRGRGEREGDDGHGGHGESESGDDHGGERRSGSDRGQRGERASGDDHDDRSGPSGHRGGSSASSDDRSGPSREGSESRSGEHRSGHDDSGAGDGGSSGSGDGVEDGAGSGDSLGGDSLSGSSGSGSGDELSHDRGSGSDGDSGSGVDDFQLSGGS